MKTKAKRTKKTIKVSYVIDEAVGITSIKATTDTRDPILSYVLDEIKKHPRKVHHTTAFKFTGLCVGICRRSLYILKAIKTACGKEFGKRDIDRRQNDGVF